MQSLLSTSAFYYSNPEFYLIRRLTDSEYHVEPKDRTIRSFKISKCGKTWVVDNRHMQLHAAQIGELIERRYR